MKTLAIILCVLVCGYDIGKAIKHFKENRYMWCGFFISAAIWTFTGAIHSGLI